MSLEARLTEAFEAAFPGVPAEEIPLMSAESNDAWDSLATVTLLSLIEEEFDISVDPTEVAGLLAFTKLRDYLAAHCDAVT